eukprot:SAG31_NODE_10079_length_1186_cov_1.609016_1_plen_57_part_10
MVALIPPAEATGPVRVGVAGLTFPNAGGLGLAIGAGASFPAGVGSAGGGGLLRSGVA